MKKAQAENKPVMIFIYEEWCPRCRYMDQTTFMNHDVIQLSSNFVNIKVIGTQQGTLYNYTAPPLVVFTDPYGNPLITRSTELSAGDVLGLQRSVLASAPFPSPTGAIQTSVIVSNSPLNSASATAEKKGLAIPGFNIFSNFGSCTFYFVGQIGDLMKIAIIQFGGSNCDLDVYKALDKPRRELRICTVQRAFNRCRWRDYSRWVFGR